MKSSSLKNTFSLQDVSIGIVMSRFNETISRSLLKGAVDGIEDSGISKSSLKIIEVPGAFEIPLAAQALARTKKIHGIICVGAVIRGETPHFDFVCRAVTDGCLRLQLDHSIPMAFGVLTTDTVEQALARAKPDSSNKGFEAAKVVLEMIEMISRVQHG
jgi:6,7-dimethyl-8-ribityllumazine synthase